MEWMRKQGAPDKGTTRRVVCDRAGRRDTWRRLAARAPRQAFEGGPGFAKQRSGAVCRVAGWADGGEKEGEAKKRHTLGHAKHETGRRTWAGRM